MAKPKTRTKAEIFLITPVLIKKQQNNYPYKACTHDKPCNIVFTGKMPPLKSKGLVEKGFRGVEYAGRKLLNKISGALNKKQTELMFKELADVDETSETYIAKLVKAGRFFGKNKEVEINLESNRLFDLANSKEPCIFIMNHDNQKHDPEMLAIFSALLNSEYIKAGKAASCPRPKIILNEDILLTMDEKMRKIFEKLGAVGIDASLYSADGSKNGRKLLPTMKDFVNDKAHIYIFPEGKNAGFKKMRLQDKFQTGVAEMVHKLAQKKEQVKVVPLAFAYNDKSKTLLSSIHIGEPVFFKKNGNNVLATSGNVMKSDFASKNYIDFFKKQSDEEFTTLTEKGIPVSGKELPSYIAGVLCENLQICKEEAKKVLPKTSLKDKVLEV